MHALCRRSCFALFAIMLLPLISQAQPLPSKNERLFHVGRVWGYIKYFHPGAAGCINNMDSVLLETITVVDSATSYGSFERGLLQLFEKAGPIIVATEPEINVDTLSKLNLDLRWHHDAALPLSVRLKLDSIRVNFRPFDNCYFKGLDKEGVFYSIEEKDYASSIAIKTPYPLLLLFRAWNIHNYFSPYRRLLQPTWDSTLIDLIPYFERISSNLELHLAFVRYQARQLDAHSFTKSTLVESHFGSSYLPCLLTLVDNRTVITKVFSDTSSLRVGDVVLTIDGTLVDVIRDSLRPYTAGGAREIVDRNISMHLLRGKRLLSTLEVENTDGVRSVVVKRTRNIFPSDSLYRPRGDGMAWKTLPGDIGYVNIGLLKVAEIPIMYEELRSKKALIFDMRNYPSESVLYPMADLLFPSERAFCIAHVPDPTYPGMFENIVLYCGPFASNPNYYRGELRILQNEITQSQAEFTIMAWQTHPNTKIIGSQTAGADGNVSTLVFPTSLSLVYSGIGILYPDRRETQIVGIEEDITVTPSINGIRAGCDEVLEAALASLSVKRDGKHVQPDFAASVNSAGRLVLQTSSGLDQGTITIYDLVGRQVLQHTYSEAGITISHLPNGAYLLELTSQGEIRRTRVRKGL